MNKTFKFALLTTTLISTAAMGSEREEFDSPYTKYAKKHPSTPDGVNAYVQDSRLGELETPYTLKTKKKGIAAGISRRHIQFKLEDEKEDRAHVAQQEQEARELEAEKIIEGLNIKLGAFQEQRESFEGDLQSLEEKQKELKLQAAQLEKELEEKELEIQTSKEEALKTSESLAEKEDELAKTKESRARVTTYLEGELAKTNTELLALMEEHAKVKSEKKAVDESYDSTLAKLRLATEKKKEDAKRNTDGAAEKIIDDIKL